MQAQATKPKQRPKSAEGQRAIETMSADQLHEMASNLQDLRQRAHDPSIDELVGQADEKLAAHRAHLEAIDARLDEINAATSARTRNRREAEATAQQEAKGRAKDGLIKEIEFFLGHVERMNKAAISLRESFQGALESMAKMAAEARLASQTTGRDWDLSSVNHLYLEKRLSYRLTNALHGTIPRNPSRLGFILLPSVPNNQNAEPDWAAAEEALLRRAIYDRLFPSTNDEGCKTQ